MRGGRRCPSSKCLRRATGARKTSETTATRWSWRLTVGLSYLDKVAETPSHSSSRLGAPLKRRSIKPSTMSVFMLNAVGLDWKNVAHVNSYHVPEPDGSILGATAEMARQFRQRMPDLYGLVSAWRCLAIPRCASKSASLLFGTIRCLRYLPAWPPGAFRKGGLSSRPGDRTGVLGVLWRS
jgi:hypothetical protein